jgi:disulfide bond formation protein DsbB
MAAPLWPRLLALALPAALLGGAWFSQLVGGLPPCEMCHWQRWPHYAALLPALGALAVRQGAAQTVLAMLAAVLIAVSGTIGVFHAGVEYGWWEGITACAAGATSGSLEDLLNAPVIRCDVAPWTLAGISLAGYNAILSLGGAAAILLGLARHRRSPM